MRNVLSAVVLMSAISAVQADEGMWTLNNFPTELVKSKYGFSATESWLNHVRLSSTRFGTFCSSSFVSPNGLVMTNHHCAVSCLQDLSSKENDYVAKGFYAETATAEKQCPELQINQLVDITNVTDRINKATAGKAESEFKKELDAEKARITKECAGDDTHCEVVTLYSGGRYDLYRYRRYDDVRMVFAPEQSAAFFGGDPDNFMFPRYNLDVSFVRVYDGGKPISADHYFKWSAKGTERDSLTFITGHPGSTQREYTVAELESMRDFELPKALMYLSEYRGMLNQFQTRGPEQARIATRLVFGIENSLKALRGEREALVNGRAFGQKVENERTLRKQVEADPKVRADAGGAWAAIEKAVQREHALGDPYLYLEAGRGFASRQYQIARMLVRAAEELPKANDERLPGYADADLPALKANLLSAAPIHDELELETLTFSLTKLVEALGPDHRTVRDLLGAKSPRELATELVASDLEKVEKRKALLEGGKAAVAASDDPMIQFARKVDGHARQIRKQYEEEVESPLKRNRELLGKARYAVEGTGTYPDATFTLRISYGSVKGWTENGTEISPFTILGGTFERATGRPPFQLPDSWHKAKDKLDLTTPYNFVTTNDIIGGNSGSPVINKDAEIVGIVFDGNIHSLGGAFWFDQEKNRSVAVDSRAIIETLDKVYGARRVLQELLPGK